MLHARVDLLLQASEVLLREAAERPEVTDAYRSRWHDEQQRLREAHAHWSLLMPAFRADFTQPTPTILNRILSLEGFSTDLPVDSEDRGFSAWNTVVTLDPKKPPSDNGKGLSTWLLKNHLIKGLLLPSIALLQFLEEALPVEVPALTDHVRAWSHDLDKIARSLTASLSIIDAEWKRTPLYESSVRQFIRQKHAFRWDRVSFEAILLGLPRPEQAQPEVICRLRYPRIPSQRSGLFSPKAALLFFHEEG